MPLTKDRVENIYLQRHHECRHTIPQFRIKQSALILSTISEMNIEKHELRMMQYLKQKTPTWQAMTLCNQFIYSSICLYIR